MAEQIQGDPPREAPEGVKLLLTRTAVRQFTDQPVADDLVTLMTEAMVAAPSASNRQAWAFVVVRDPRTLRLVRAFAPGIIAPPTMIVAACFDRPRATLDGGEGADEGLLCLAMAVQNLLLSAHALGLGGCPVASFREEPIRLILGLPAHIEPVLLVPVGHPARRNPHAARRDANEVIHHECWNGS
ncbi:nitroreductase family protein [Actinomadura harenae]|uniref:Nitroreductase family protein n=1 Tax=Actinomadura harenae TaxID=2483351 RepID=A0A3M2M669_9ACTN|nr:nitroreductase family protein [Actinomadura harenae]RMI44353.1 nitroreductase family protein [Actinomadura harenae]